MKLEANRFFRYYYFNHTKQKASELTPQQRREARCLAIFLGIISFGIIPLVSLCLYNKSYKIKPLDEDIYPFTVANKVDTQKEIISPKQEADPVIPQEPKKEKETPLLQMKFDETHPLSKSIEGEFIKHDEKAQNILGEILNKQGYPIPLEGKIDFSILAQDGINPPYVDDLFENAFLSIPLDYLLDTCNNEDFDQRYEQVNPRLRELIELRLQQYEEAIQLKKRFDKSCKNACFWDLVFPWKKSPLKYKLLSQKELLSLKVKDITIGFINYSGSISSDKDPEYHPQFPEDIRELALSDLPYVTPSQYTSKQLIQLPIQLTLLLSDETFQSIDFADCLDHTLFTIANFEDLSSKLSAKQLDHFVSRITLNQGLFNKLFPEPPENAKNSILNQLSSETLTKICKFFTDKHWYALDTARIGDINFPEAKLSKRGLVVAIYCIVYRSKDVIPHLPAPSFIFLCKHFKERQWDKVSYDMTPNLIAKMNFIELNFPKKVLQSIFAGIGLPENPHDYHRIRELPKDQRDFIINQLR